MAYLEQRSFYIDSVILATGHLHDTVTGLYQADSHINCQPHAWTRLEGSCSSLVLKLAKQMIIKVTNS